MAQLIPVAIYCTVSVGGITAHTPRSAGNHVLSFNVDKVRGQAGTCSVSLRVYKGQASFSSGGDIRISAGANGAMNNIFYGFIKSITISPCRENPSFVIMNITGIDVLSKLEGRKYTRRCRSVSGTWVSIEGVTREGLRSSKLTYLPLDPHLSISGGKLNKEDNLTRTRTQGLTAFEKLTTNVNTKDTMFKVQNVESPIAAGGVS
jgi:hypothetical protein